MNNLESLFQNSFGEKADTKTVLLAAGSNRKYYRMSSKNFSAIGSENDDADENRAFVAIARKMLSEGLPVPRIFAVSADWKAYIQEDLGDTLLFDFIEAGRKTGYFSEPEKAALHKTIALLPSLQVKTADSFDFSTCYPQSEFNKRTVFWDLNYFKYYFLKPLGVEFSENLLENDFERFAVILTEQALNGFMYRDFQSRNVMLRDGKPYFIDFQGGRKGPLQYDVASFLWQAKASFSQPLREELLETYLTELQKIYSVDAAAFRNSLKQYVLLRSLQTLGAYGFRGYFEKKAHFLQSIPPAIRNLKQTVENASDDYQYLIELLRKICRLPAFFEKEARQGLKVRVCSFSYLRGIPDDNSGNGGGFVFDCRAIHNPGRYEQYRQLTGRDRAVSDFLEKDGEIISFLKNVFSITDASIERYLQRHFTSLHIAFGCTGGQHRSVYAAEKTAMHIREKYPEVEVELIHREQQ